MLWRVLPILSAIAFGAVSFGLLWATRAEILACKTDQLFYGAGRGGYGMESRERARCGVDVVVQPASRTDNPKLETEGKIVLGLVTLVPAWIGLVVGDRIARKKQRDRRRAERTREERT
jgi:hypothetical protein